MNHYIKRSDEISVGCRLGAMGYMQIEYDREGNSDSTPLGKYITWTTKDVRC